MVCPQGWKLVCSIALLGPVLPLVSSEDTHRDARHSPLLPCHHYVDPRRKGAQSKRRK